MEQSDNTRHLPALEVGITGGIGSGKTTVCRIFETLGIPVYSSDERAKSLMVENDNVRSAIESLFGEKAYLPSGQLDRAHLSSLVFEDKNLLEKLNAIVHPAVFADAEKWHAEQAGVPYTLREAALLVESGSYLSLDKLIVVTAPRSLRIQRVMQRDGVGQREVEARMEKQLPEREKIAKADFVINNDGTHLIVPQVVDIHRSLLKFSNLLKNNAANPNN